MESTTAHALPGYILIDPIEKDKKSDMIAVVDAADRAYKGTVVSVGEPKITDNGTKIEAPVKKGDFVLYSIAGCEETKLKVGDDYRHRFVIAPFGRILLKIDE